MTTLSRDRRMPSASPRPTCAAHARMTIAAILCLAGPASASAQASAAARYPLTSTERLQLQNVTAQAVTHAGKRGVRITTSAEARRLEAQPNPPQSPIERLAVIEGSDFANGVIEAEISGVPAPDAPEGARGFVGIAFRVQPDLKTYDAFYLRPTNGRAEDQVRRNHSAQYISHPAWPWMRLRQETPGRYESYVDLVPNVWTKVRIEVRGDTARLYVHGAAQPTLIVNDVKSGAQARGAIALWIDGGTIAHFRDVRVSRSAR